MQLELSSLTISFLIHSTEDELRLIHDVSNAFQIDEGEIEVSSLEGHFGNELKFAKAHITGKRASEISISTISGAPSSERKTAASILETLIDEHDALYLRVDRQKLPSISLQGEEEPIRLKLKPKNRFENRSKMLDSYSQVLRK
ncbi:MAG: RNA-binding domain-containing protein [Nitrososphaerales archaeon]